MWPLVMYSNNFEIVCTVAFTESQTGLIWNTFLFKIVIIQYLSAWFLDTTTSTCHSSCLAALKYCARPPCFKRNIITIIMLFTVTVFQEIRTMTMARRNMIAELIVVASKNQRTVSNQYNYFTCMYLRYYSSLPEYMKRVIVHPSFLNVSFKEAENALMSMEQGDAIFRPSSKVCVIKNH